jgi:hypothetical protein
MRYALLIHENTDASVGLSDEERRDLTGEYFALRDDPRVVDGARLKPPKTATCIRVQSGETLVSDGPFAETKEVFGGYFVLDAEHLDAAIDIASRIPAARMGGIVEIRPIMEYPR